jgi:hypothetical protein
MENAGMYKLYGMAVWSTLSGQGHSQVAALATGRPHERQAQLYEPGLLKNSWAPSDVGLAVSRHHRESEEQYLVSSLKNYVSWRRLEQQRL